MSVNNLFDVPGFDGLDQVTRKFNISLKAIGGFVRRVATKLRDNENELPDDVMQLVPFSSDVDLIHSGKQDDTPAIAAAIIDHVPFGEAIRWQVRSAAEDTVYSQSLPFSGIVPVNLMSLASNNGHGIEDPWSGRSDIQNRRYRYIRNGFYKDSPLYRNRRDLELFSALLYFKVLVDDSSVGKSLPNQPGMSEARTVVHETSETMDALVAFQESSYLRARLLYLLKDIRSFAYHAYDWNELRAVFGLDQLQAYLSRDSMFGLGSRTKEILNNDTPVTISAHLGGDQYRFPDFPGNWEQENLSRDLLNVDLGDERTGRLADGQEIIAASPRISLATGISQSERTNEFIHVAVPLNGAQVLKLRSIPENDLAILIKLEDPERDTRTLVFAPPSVCSIASRENAEKGMLWVRVNAFGLLRDAKDVTEGSDPTVQLFLIGRRTQTGTRSEPYEHPLQLSKNPRPAAQNVIVFVHGIFSDSESCFKELRDLIKSDPRAASYRLDPFNYDFHDEIETSAGHLADYLRTLPLSSTIILICHSMGGLVGRMAILKGGVPKIARLIMLGTPNFGVLRTAQTGLLSQLSLYMAGQLYAVFRKRGLRDLVQVPKIFSAAIESGSKNADDVEYITIPGEFFNDNRQFWNVGRAGERSLWTTAFGSISLISELLNAVPLWRVGLARPHDGIVESASNSLIPAGPDRRSEKAGTINDPEQFGHSYFHIEHNTCADLTHVTLQHDPQIVGLVKELALASGVDHWRESLTKEQARSLKITPSFARTMATAK